jgi:trigger factor
VKLKIEKEFTEDHQVKLTVEIDPDKLESSKKRAARNIARRMKIPGFRPGKAPYHVITRYAGEATILEEGIDILVQDIYPELIQDAKIEPYGPGTLENIPSLDPPILEFIVPLEAEVELGDYRSIRKDFSPTAVKDDDVDEILKNLQEQRALVEPVDRPVAVGDLVTVRISAREDNNDGQDPADALYPERSIPFLILSDDESADDEWPFPGFSSHLLGLAAGEQGQVTKNYPDDGEDSKFSGKDVIFHFNVEDVKERTLPELTDEFASTIGEFEDIGVLRDEIRDSLENQAEQTYQEEYDQAILEQLVASSTIKFPPQMLDKQIENYIENLSSNLEQQNLDLDLYLKTRDMTLEELREDTTPVAQKRLQRTLSLIELAKSEEIEIDPEELQKETINAINAIYYSNDDEAESKPTERDLAIITNNVLTSMLANQALDRFRNIASGVEELSQSKEDSKLKSTDHEESEVENDADVQPTEDGEMDDGIVETTMQQEDEVPTESDDPEISGDHDS